MTYRPLLAIALSLSTSVAFAQASEMHALVGATVVDVSNGGQNSADVPDSVVLLQGSQTVAVEPRGSVEIPPGTAVVNVSGKFIGACPTCELTASAWTQAFLAAK